ncbi:MAG: hypothetical protein PW786_12105 [Arachidicoccus sp.]|nr:hypothetical protein [Arachidicoccus sp.]
MFLQIKKYFLGIISLVSLQNIFAQTDSIEWHQSFDKAKSVMKNISGQNATLYNQLSGQLDSLCIQNPSNPEAWYFLGSAIDRYNTSTGEEIPASSLELAQKASAAFSNCLDFSKGKYQGDILLFDPHTKILSVWGTQAFKYLVRNDKDSAVWCLQQAEANGAINQTVKGYFQQVLDECSPDSYLFTNGDLYMYYLAYIQYVLQYRQDVHCISLNFLNTQWYPQAMNKLNILPLNISQDSLSKIGNTAWKTQNIALQNLSGMQGDSVVAWNVKPTNDKFLLRSDIILKSFLEKNAFQKNVYFPADVPENMRLFLNINNYAQLCGLTLKIDPEKNSTKLSFLQNRLAQLNELSAEDSAFTDNKDNIQVLNNYRFAYTAAASLALQQNQYAAAQDIISYEEKKYPENMLPFYADVTKNWFANFKQKVMDTVVNK